MQGVKILVGKLMVVGADESKLYLGIIFKLQKEGALIPIESRSFTFDLRKMIL